MARIKSGTFLCAALKVDKSRAKVELESNQSRTRVEVNKSEGFYSEALFLGFFLANLVLMLTKC